MIRRDRKRQVVVQNVRVLTITFSGIVQVGDVLGDSHPFSYGEAYGGYRGAPSFATAPIAAPANTRLNFNNQVDEDVMDNNIVGERPETFRPNVFGGGAR